VDEDVDVFGEVPAIFREVSRLCLVVMERWPDSWQGRVIAQFWFGYEEHWMDGPFPA